MKDIYFGNGIHDLENDSGNYFRWASDQFEFYVRNKDIIQIEFHIFSNNIGSIDMFDGFNNFGLTYKSGFSLIRYNLNENTNKLIFKQNYFVPSQTNPSSNDNRKLSYRIYNIKVKYKTGRFKIFKSDEVGYFIDYIEKDDNDYQVTSYGEYGEMFIKTNINNLSGKINLNLDQTSFYSHRSGWNYVIKNLFEFNNENGVLFDGFLENAFSWRKSEYVKNDIIPYKQPWVGVLHNPPNMPLWFSDNNAYPQSIIHDPYFRESINNCKGLYVLSDYYARFLKHYLPHVPIEVLYHPTEIPNVKFSYNKFINNKNKKVVNIGWWLRKLNSIFLLDVPNKIRLMPNNKCKDTILRLTNIERSLMNLKLTTKQLNSVELVDHLSNEEYDNLLSENIVFLDLYDTSANNAVIECIARGTPLLINKHPATLEYLGEDYPFYFDNLEEASRKVQDFILIKETHQYLMSFEKRKQITIEYFKEQLINNKIYKSL